MLRNVRSFLKAKVYGLLMRLESEKPIIWFWRHTGQNVDYLQQKDLADRFSLIYSNNVWTNRQPGECASGTGSTVCATAQISSDLPRLLESIRAKSLLDLGCGSFLWMRNVDLRIKYIGVDIVTSVIEDNIARCQDESHEFAVMNGCVDPLPNADVILCREVMFHLSFRDARNLLRNVKRSAAKYLLCTTDPTTEINADIPSGGWRDINLEKRPYSLGRPLMTISDAVPDNPSRILGLWLVETLPL